MGKYHRPDKLKDALALLSHDGMQVVAGCTDVFASTSNVALCGPVLDVTAIDTLRGITCMEGGAGWRIGATTTWRDVAQTPLPAGFDMLKLAARQIGAVQVQTAGTVAGNICNASPAADAIPPLLALDADVEISAQSGMRLVPLGEFVVGPRQTILKPDEMVSAILVPNAATRGISAFRKLGARKHLVISIAMVAVRLTFRAGTIDDAAIAVGACGPVAVRLPGVEAALRGMDMGQAVGAVRDDDICADLAPISDMRSSDNYRSQSACALVRECVGRLVQSEWERAQ